MDMGWGLPSGSPKGSWESLALEGPARGGKMRGVFGGWVSCMALLSGWKGEPAWCDEARGTDGRTDGRQARACRGLYKLCLKRMQKVLLPVCKIETGVCRLSSGLLLLCRRSGMSSWGAGLRSGDCWLWQQRQPEPE